MHVAAAPAKEGGLWLAWPRDNWPTFAIKFTFPEETVEENVYAGRFEPRRATPESSPARRSSRRSRSARPVTPTSPATWRACAAGARASAGRSSRSCAVTPTATPSSRIDGRGRPDGSILDFYRYVLDAAALDFGLISDHQYGAEREYWWWLEEKLADLFHAPERYVSMFGYERSVSFPSGHRNVVHAERGTGPVPFFGKTSYDEPGVAERPVPQHQSERAGSTTPRCSTRRCAAAAASPFRTPAPPRWAPTGATTIPRSSRWSRSSRATATATSSPARRSPTARTISSASRSRRSAAGFVSNALAKGYKLGFIASSDHASTHLSYAMVWATDRSRRAVLDAMRARRTYAATDNIVLEFWIGDQFMGGELRAGAGGVPEIRVKAVGTKPFLTAEILRNGQPIHRSSPARADVELRFRDLEPIPGRATTTCA